MEPEDRASAPSAEVPLAGELIFENGNPAGPRRALSLPLTIIGGAAGCDIRLKDGGVEPMHCILAATPGGFQVRDLQTEAGTRLNGQSVSLASVHDGDTLQIGAYVFRLSISLVEPPSPDALRIQAAAVAAQQTALAEEEARLHQRRQALEQQEEQLSRHLEEERSQLLELGAKAKEERTALADERTAHEQHVQQTSAELNAGQRELVEQQQEVQAERRRLEELRVRLRKHWQRRFKSEQERLRMLAEQLANENCNVAKEREAVAQAREAVAAERLAFNTQYELGRRQIRDAWTRLRHDRGLWRQRRSREQAALRLRGRELEEMQFSLAAAEQLLRQESTSWHARRDALEKEVAGLTQRLRNQRDKFLEQQLELNRLEAALRDRQAQSASPSSHTEGNVGAAPAAATAVNVTETAAPVPPVSARNPRLIDLDRLASELAEQRRLLAEQWQRLIQHQERWEQERAAAATELEGLLRPVQEQEETLRKREQACRALEEDLANRQRELTQLRHHLVGWRARLRACEASWERERRSLLLEVRERERRVEERFKRIDDIRLRWAERRRREIKTLHEDLIEAEVLRREYAQLRQKWQERYTAVEIENRLLTEKLLSLEQFQQEVLLRSGDAPAAQRQIERLRRRWLDQNAAAIRTFREEQQNLKKELAVLEKRHAELHKTAETVLAADERFNEQRALWEQREAESSERLQQVQKDLKIARAQRDCAAQQADKVKEEIEQVARTLLLESAAAFPVERAA